MKKIPLLLIFSIILLLTISLKPSPALAIGPGESCSTPGAFINCDIPKAGGGTITGCCGCSWNTGKWEVVSSEPCPSKPAPGAGEQIVNPVLEKYGWGEGATLLANLVAQFLSVAFILGGVILLAMILISGISWMTAGGDQNKLKAAQGRLTSALIGFIILVALRAILGFIAGVLEIDWLRTLKITWPTP